MGNITLSPYLFFTGNCQEAMEFYKEVFGGELQTSPNPDGKGLMHADLSGGVIDLMASDGTRTTPYEVCRISLSLSGTDTEKLTELFDKLSEGGKDITALKTESWGDVFGSLTDKFGIDWLVNISAS